MENQVLQQVLVDGEYVSRPVDVYQLLARAQRQTDVEMQEPEARPQPEIPQVGLMSRTLFPSTLVKFILSASIRKGQRNDVVFVGENSVHLYEIHDHGHLHHIASKSDFKGSILAARRFGAPVKTAVSPRQGMSIKKTDTQDRQESTRSDHADAMPPEAIILTLTSRRLVLLWTEQNAAGETVFRQKFVRLPAGSSMHDTPGAFLAVDPKCRAIAVSTPEGQCTLYKTAPLDKWKGYPHSTREMTPIEDERHLSLQARVLHMDFLSASSDPDDVHVILVFVLAHNGKTKITCYDWDTRYDVSTAAIRAERVSVDYEDHNPALLIPATRTPDFLLVSNSHIATYTNVLSGTPQRYVTPISPEILRPLFPGESKNQPLWVQWQRVARNDDFSREVFYIAREDGRLIYTELMRTNLIEISDAGEWSHPLDRGFATLNVDAGSLTSRNADVLIASGPTSDGSLQKVGGSDPRNTRPSFTPHFVESIPSWTPITDLMVTRLPGLRSPFERERDSIFVANGRSQHGAVSELRKGLRAIVYDHSQGMTGVTGLWLLDHRREKVEYGGKEVYQHHASFVFSLPPESMTFCVTREGDFWEVHQFSTEYEPGQSGVSGQETISAGIVSEQLAIQITRRQLLLLDRPNLTCVRTLAISELAQNSGSRISDITLAAVASTPSPHVAISFREGSSVTLVVIPIGQDGTFGSPIRQNLAADPTCLKFFDINNALHVFVGSVDLKLNLYIIHEKALYPVLSVEPSNQVSAPSLSHMPMVCESAVFLTSEAQSTIVCGMRNGILLSISIESILRSGRYETQDLSLIRMGTAAVIVTPSGTDKLCAFASCGVDFCRVSLPSSSRKLDISSVWFRQNSDEQFHQGPVSAFDQVPFYQQSVDGNGIGGFMFAVSGDRLLYARLDYDTVRSTQSSHSILGLEQSKTVPMRTATTATPTKVVYTENKRKLVVATTEMKEIRAPPNGYRTMHSTLKLMNVADNPVIKEEPKGKEGIKQEAKDEEEEAIVSNICSQITLQNYERVYTILDWIVQDSRDRPHHFLYVGTGVMKGPGREIGRRLFFQISKDDNKFKLKKEKTYNSPVRCLALMHVKDRADLITVVGTTMMLEEFEIENSRWAKRAEIELPSAGIHVSVSNSHIYVSTALHSHICFAVVSSQGCVLPLAFEKVFSDSRQRDAAHHLQMDLNLSPLPAHPTDPEQSQPSPDPNSIVLVSDKKCSVAGLLYPTHRTFKNSTTTLFEARLPRSITRLARGAIRPPWRRPFTPTSTATQQITGIIADDIIGTSSDGTATTFSILTPQALKLLRFLQNIITNKEARVYDASHITTRPNGSAHMFAMLMNNAEGDQSDDGKIIKKRDVDPDVGRWNPSLAHVDADVLERGLGDDVRGGLRTLVREGTDHEVWVLFCELARELGVVGASGDGDVSMGDEDGEEDMVVEGVGRWLDDVLMPVL
ncbi:hypothetical protein BU24DRAFT_58917 [Aaosphaeria arxii CBS 175.79]|uniref:RSE1/DDB1/CPSF1 first beta-propeller domain-containing protein n=1 Tax=Aaosphaeria arxii CBS 175.79 TaxID=1450172 RepID=A0A6A5XBY4_9PLEO|nr:uncharacterized protein BU24DRAFT_58917 [Aaosphaeria arxii CBS 175.79]KAF2010468.1 hypothetical protein BU24DRAFT_58917 [Aaosphaeria arxii CBS 175.79]